jgi:hypothetical protein
MRVNAHTEIVNHVTISVLSIQERIIPGSPSRRNARVGFQRVFNCEVP